jgi:hypothetical protein
LFVGTDGTLQVARSSSFSRLAYLAVLRWFFRAKFGVEMHPIKPIPQTHANVQT